MGGTHAAVLRAAAALLTALASLLAVSCRGRRESSYPDLEAARKDGAFSRGWLPPFLPASATALREMHDLDSNESLLAFRFDPSDPSLRIAPCSVVAESDVAPPPRFRGASWWPPSLLSDRRGGLRFFTCSEGTQHGAPPAAWLALDVGRGEAFFWRSSR